MFMFMMKSSVWIIHWCEGVGSISNKMQFFNKNFIRSIFSIKKPIVPSKKVNKWLFFSQKMQFLAKNAIFSYFLPKNQIFYKKVAHFLEYGKVKLGLKRLNFIVTLGFCPPLLVHLCYPGGYFAHYVFAKKWILHYTTPNNYNDTPNFVSFGGRFINWNRFKSPRTMTPKTILWFPAII